MLREEILAKVAPDVLASRDPEAIAAAVSLGRTRVVSRLGGIGAVLEALGTADGSSLLDRLYAQKDSLPALRWAWVLIDRGDLDFGSQRTREMIDLLVPGDAGAALKALAEVPDPVSEYDVRCALWDAAGVWLGGE